MESVLLKNKRDGLKNLIAEQQWCVANDKDERADDLEDKIVKVRKEIKQLEEIEKNQLDEDED